MKEVSQFEANLIRTLRCVVGQIPIEQTLPAILREWPCPRCLSRACVELVKDTLAKGIPRFLARQGWNVERFIHDESIVEGRLWQRSPLEHRQLEFSRHTLEWLIWLTAENPGKPESLPNIPWDDCTVGDAVLFLLTFARLRETPAEANLLGTGVIKGNSLVALVFPEAFADQECSSSVEEIGRWFRPDRAWLLEALQPWSRMRWLETETEKRRVLSRDELQNVGAAQQAILDAYLDAADRSGRRDLTRFVMDVAVDLLRSSTDDDRANWFDRVDVGDLRIADRQSVYESGLVLLRSLSRLDQWNQSARNIGFYDEEYEASQLWKSDWEKWNGDSVCRQAREIVDSLAEFTVS